ncbi:hypothetical protein [Schaalia sp. ZJ405]|nr:hypothetical protein [Schaalia sp. ZJ405]
MNIIVLYPGCICVTRVLVLVNDSRGTRTSPARPAHRTTGALRA